MAVFMLAAALVDLFIELLLWTLPVFALLDEEEASENVTLDDEAADADAADADFVVDLVFDEA